MKKAITIFILTFILQSASFSQTPDGGSSNIRESVAYLVGNEDMGYKNKVFLCYARDIVSVNDKEIPALSYFVNNKKDFIGGILVNEKNKKTLIKDLYLEQKNDVISLKVIGQKFTRYIDVEMSNYFLDFDYDFAKFYTSNIGIWSIYKKK